MHTPFPSGNNLTFGQILDPAMKITDRQDANQYKRAYIKYMLSNYPDVKTEAQAIECVNKNLGYYAGYGSNEQRERVERLFDCSHPVFGSISTNGAPTSQEAFQAGLNGALERYK